MRSLLDAGVLDELRLLVHPIVVGHGKRLFADGAQVPLRLASSRTLETGVQYVIYVPGRGVDCEAGGVARRTGWKP